MELTQPMWVLHVIWVEEVNQSYGGTLLPCPTGIILIGCGEETPRGSSPSASQRSKASITRLKARFNQRHKIWIMTGRCSKADKVAPGCRWNQEALVEPMIGRHRRSRPMVRPGPSFLPAPSPAMGSAKAVVGWELKESLHPRLRLGGNDGSYICLIVWL